MLYACALANSFTLSRHKQEAIYFLVVAMRAKVWKDTACTTASGEKSTSKMRPKLEPSPAALAAFGAGAAFAAAGAALEPPNEGKEMDGAENDGKEMDGAESDGPPASFFVLLARTGVFFFAWSSSNCAAARLLASPLATCANSTGAALAIGATIIVAANTTAPTCVRSARTTAAAPRACAVDRRQTWVLPTVVVVVVVAIIVGGVRA